MINYIIFAYGNNSTIIMLEQLPVLLQYAFTVNCQNCNGILFQIKIIDEFIRYRKNSTKKQHPLPDPKQDTANFYMLHSQIIPDTIIIQKVAYLNKQDPFKMLFLNEIKCGQCKSKIGIKILSISSEFANYQLLGRVLIDVGCVRVKTVKQDVTDQVVSRFSDDWENQTQLDYDLQGNYAYNFNTNNRQEDIMIKSQKIHKTNPYNKLTNQKSAQPPRQLKTTIHKHQRIETTVTQSVNNNQIKTKKIQNIQRQYMRERLLRQSQYQYEQTKQVIKQIVGTIQFYNDILASLEKRVSQSENVCMLLKKRVEEIIPFLRKKSKD